MIKPNQFSGQMNCEAEDLLGEERVKKEWKVSDMIKKSKVYVRYFTFRHKNTIFIGLQTGFSIFNNKLILSINKTVQR